MSNAQPKLELPPVPRKKLAPVVQMAREIGFELAPDRDTVLTDESAAELAYRVGVVLGWDAPLDNLAYTLAQYVGRTLDSEFIKTLSWQIAARENELLTSLLVGYTRPVKNEWIGCEIMAVEPSVWRKESAGTLFTMFALSGHPAGHTFKRNFPDTFLNWFAYRLGFNRRIRYDGDARHFIGLRLWGYLEPQHESDEIVFNEWGMNPDFKKHNLEIIRLRTRFEYEKAECPHGRDDYCWDCPNTAAQCKASCIPRQ